MWQNGQTHYVTSYTVMENGDFDIILLEEYSCNTKEQLHARERYWIESMECVNIKIPTRSKAEWIVTNADDIREKRKAYYEANADAFRER
eukprot:48108-Eustigmatos_ZCMA.PRE.1